jgi:hypothetical protein
MKLYDLPEGTILEITYAEGETAQYELTANRENPNYDTDYISREALDTVDDRHVRIVSVPYEVTLKLAEWLDNVYTKTGKPENLIIEAAAEAKKTKHDSYILDRPEKVQPTAMNDPKMGPPNPPNPTWNRPFG